MSKVCLFVHMETLNTQHSFNKIIQMLYKSFIVQRSENHSTVSLSSFRIQILDLKSRNLCNCFLKKKQDELIAHMSYKGRKGDLIDHVFIYRKGQEGRLHVYLLFKSQRGGKVPFDSKGIIAIWLQKDFLKCLGILTYLEKKLYIVMDVYK
jgi:hypothetical protein